MGLNRSILSPGELLYDFQFSMSSCFDIKNACFNKHIYIDFNLLRILDSITWITHASISKKLNK